MEQEGFARSSLNPFMFPGIDAVNLLILRFVAARFIARFCTIKPCAINRAATMWSPAFIATETSDETDWQLYQPVCAQNLSDPAGKGPVFEFVNHSPWEPDSHVPQYNPLGKVPAFIDDQQLTGLTPRSLLR